MGQQSEVQELPFERLKGIFQEVKAEVRAEITFGIYRGEEPGYGGGIHRRDRDVGIAEADLDTFEGKIGPGVDVGIERSRIGAVKADIVGGGYCGYGIDESQIDSFEGSIQAFWGINESTLKRVTGKIKVGSIGIIDSDIGHVTADIEAGNKEDSRGTAIMRSRIGIYEGNILAERTAIDRSSIDLVLGNIIVKNDWADPVFKDSHGITVVGDQIKGSYLGSNASGNLVVVNKIDTDHEIRGISVLTTKPHEAFPTYLGTIEELQMFLRQNPRALRAVAAFGLDGRKEYSLSDLLALNELYKKTLWDPTEERKIEEQWPRGIVELYNRIFSTALTNSSFEKEADAARLKELRKKHSYRGKFLRHEMPFDAYVEACREYFKDWQPSEREHWGWTNWEDEERFRKIIDVRKQQFQNHGRAGLAINSENDRLTELHWKVPGLFHRLSREDYIPLLKAWDRVFENAKKDAVERFLTYLNKSQSQGDVDALLRNLKGSKESGMLGNDLVLIGKRRRYEDFVDYSTRLGQLLSDSAGLPQIDPFFDPSSPYAEALQQLRAERKTELENLAHLAQEAGETLSLDIEKQLKQWEYERKETGRSRVVDQKKLLKHLDKEIETKRRELTIQVVAGLGEKELRAYYAKVSGKSSDVFDALDEATRENVVEALRVHRKHRVNREAAQILIIHGNDVYNLTKNQQWLQESGLDAHLLTQGLGRQTYTIAERGDVKMHIESEKARLWKEMQELLGRYNESTGETHVAATVEDIVALGQKLKLPENADALRIYKELFKEKPKEFTDIGKHVKGVTGNVTIFVATPLEAIQMGNYFDTSCVAVEKTNGWAAAGNAVDINKQVLYAMDDSGRIVARVLTAITDDKKLAYFATYSNVPVELGRCFKDYVDGWAKQLGVEVQRGNKGNIHPLVATRWYDDSAFLQSTLN